MIYITGDIHGDIDIHKLSKHNFPEGQALTKEDYLIICGDFGLIFDAGKYNQAKKDAEQTVRDVEQAKNPPTSAATDSAKSSRPVADSAGSSQPDGDSQPVVFSDPYESPMEKWWLDWLEAQPYTVLYCDGNHENFERYADMPVYTWHGGKVHRIREHIYHLMRGQIFTLEGKRIFVMGGASSHDRIYRKNHISWWAGELPSPGEYIEARTNLAAAGNAVDLIISHCLPRAAQMRVSPLYKNDALTNFLEEIRQSVSYSHWYAGHYHVNREVLGNISVLYDRIVPVTEG